MSQFLKKIFIVSFILKILVSLFLPVTLDEYYYFLWGEYPSLSYFDHPPMTGWMMIVSQYLKLPFEGVLRLPFIILSHLTVAIWVLTLKEFLNDSKLELFALVAFLNPLWGLGGLIATPDIPLVFFWSLSIYFSHKILKADDLTSYLGLGISLGLSFLSKYQAVLFLPCLLWLIAQQKLWKKLINYKTVIAVFVALIFSAPVLWWNYQNDWASFQFQWKHGMSAQHWRWIWPFEYLGTQILIIFPTFLFFLFKDFKKAAQHWLFPFAIFPFLFFLYSSFKGRVEGNWVIMALPAFYSLAIILTQDKTIHLLRKTVYLWATLFFIALFALPFTRNKLSEVSKFQNILEATDSDKTYLSNSYQLSGFLSYKLNQTICKLPKYGRMDHMDFIEKCSQLPDHFHYISEHDHLPQIEKDFPNYKVVSESSIDEKYKFIEVKKR